MHKAGGEEVGDVVGERGMRIKSNSKIADSGIRGESRSYSHKHFGEFLRCVMDLHLIWSYFLTVLD